MDTASKYPFRSRRFKRALVVIAALATLLVLFYSILSFWGRNKWTQAQADLKAKGETLDIQALVPPDVPAEDNFFEAPLLRSVAAGNKKPREEFQKSVEGTERGRGKGLHAQARKGRQIFSAPLDLAMSAQVAQEANPSLTGEPAEVVLQHLALADGALADLREAARRPTQKHPIKYDLGLVAPMPYTPLFLQALLHLTVRIAAEASLGQGSAAEENVLLLIRLQKIYEGDPVLLSQLMRLSAVERMAGSVWEGIYRQCWSAEQLENIQTHLATIQLSPGFVLGLRGDRASMVPNFELMSKVSLLRAKNPAAIWDFPFLLPLMAYPKGLVFDDLATYSGLIQQTIETVQQKPDKRSFDPVAAATSLGSHWKYSPIRFFSRIAYVPLGKSYARLLQCEAELGEAIIACSLERERLTTGAYPNVLPTGLPLDPVTGKDFNYRKNPDGGYVLWSPGSDKADDQGTLWDDKKKVGDWAWVMPWR